ncbi:MAG: biotin/lipoyl-binding protein [Defluviitaleaceae bacterium]|nr:biotin/lipoyl-binding protein [Defluviitaleaceae bacterium]
MKKIIIALFALTTVLSFTACHSAADDFQPTARPVDAFTAPVAEVITVRGMVESIESRNVYSTLGFMIDAVLVEVGDEVVAGQTLAILDTRDLVLTIAQQRAALDQARRTSENQVTETQRMLTDSQHALNTGGNVHVVGAEAQAQAAAIQVQMLEQSLSDALRDLEEGTDPHILSAEATLRQTSMALVSARTELANMETTHANIQTLYTAGIVSRDELRQSETALASVRRLYDDLLVSYYQDARLNLENAQEFQRRGIDQLQTSLEAAQTSHRSAQSLANATRNAARQELDMLRGTVETAEILANLEHMEIALEMLEVNLEDSIITAPISGTVTAVIAREGAVGMGLMFVIENTDDLRIITSFREYDIARVHQGMTVEITSTGTGNTIHTGIIHRINPAAIIGSPVVEFEAEVRVTSPDEGLRIGMNARLDIVPEN